MNILTKFGYWLIAKDFQLPMSRLTELWKMGKDLMTQQERSRPDKPYSQVETVWTCVNLIIDIAASIQLVFSTDRDEIVESGPAYDYLFNNPRLKYRDFLANTIGFYLLFREVYWIYVEGEGGALPSILVVGPRQCRPVVKNGVLLGYKLQADTRELTLFPEDVFVIKNFNPYDTLHGVGPENSNSLSISTAYQAAQYNDASLANGARLSTVIDIPAGVPVSDEEERRMRAQFKSKQGGARNAAQVYLTKGGVKIDTISQTMADLQMVELLKTTDNKICSLFGVPPEIIGLATEAQYSHGPATQRLILFGVVPVLSIVAEAIDEGIMERFKFKDVRPDPLTLKIAQIAGEEETAKYLSKFPALAAFDRSKRLCGKKIPLRCRALYHRFRVKALQSGRRVYAWFDADSHPAIQEMVRERTEKVLAYTERGIPLKQVIDVYDLPFDTTEMPWSGEWWISMGLQPARWVIEAGPEGMNPPALPEGQTGEEEEGKSLETTDPDAEPAIGEKLTEAQRLRIWRKYIASYAPLEREMTDQVRIFFVRQQEELIKMLKAALAESKSVDRTKAAEDIIARVVFDLRREGDKLKVINRVFFERAAKLGAVQTMTEAGLPKEQVAQRTARLTQQRAVRQAIETSSHKISKVNATTQRRVASQLRQGLEKGEGLNELTGRIQGILGSNRARAQSIARTQVSGGVSSGRFAGMKAAGVKLKSWLTARDKNVREEHRAAEKKYAQGIPTEQAFVVGGESLMYPGDPSGSAAMIANCRCLLFSLFGGGKDLDRYDRLEFVHYSQLKEFLNED
jgi:HK97 family phage portal protein